MNKSKQFSVNFFVNGITHRALWLICIIACICLTSSSLKAQSASPNLTSINNETRDSSSVAQPKKIIITDVTSDSSLDSGMHDPTKTFAKVSLTTQAIALSILALAPFVIMLLTSFIKIVIVLALMRNAIGSQQTPPNQIVNGVAIILTLYVMLPVGVQMYDACQEIIQEQPRVDFMSPDSADFLLKVVDKAKEPLRDFLIKHTERGHIQSFYQMSYRVLPDQYKETLEPENFIIAIPAFITSQIKNAFEIAVLVFLPFFVIDLVTSNILLAMGMQMLSPMTISLPLKLLLVVMVDGWTLIIQGLVLSYQ